MRNFLREPVTVVTVVTPAGELATEWWPAPVVVAPGVRQLTVAAFVREYGEAVAVAVIRAGMNPK